MVAGQVRRAALRYPARRQRGSRAVVREGGVTAAWVPGCRAPASQHRTGRGRSAASVVTITKYVDQNQSPRDNHDGKAALSLTGPEHPTLITYEVRAALARVVAHIVIGNVTAATPSASRAHMFDPANPSTPRHRQPSGSRARARRRLVLARRL